MKVKISSKKIKTSNAATQRRPAKINRAVFDRHALIVGNRMPVNKVFNAVRGRELRNTLTKKGFLVTSGGNGTFICECRWDGKDLYERLNWKGQPIYGSLKALGEVGVKGFAAAIISGSELVSQAKKQAEVMTVCHKSENEDIQVALLNSFGDRYVAGVTRRDGKLAAVTMEHPSNGRNVKEAHYDNPRQVRNPRNFLASLAR